MTNNVKGFSERLHNVIPGGAHTYSRGDDQFPFNAPDILERGEGCYVFDPAGNKFLDYGMGLRSVNIGYGNKEIADVVYKEALKGNNLTRASLTELEAAELFVSTIPTVEMVKFAKHGSTVTTAAMKLARAYTGKKYIAVPREQPFFSFDDWFIGTTVLKRGVLEVVADFTLLFNYNNIESLEMLFEKYPNQIAGVMLEAATTLTPCDNSCSKSEKSNCASCPNSKLNFLHKVKALCLSNDTLFILDEMITGFRWNLKGAQSFFGIEPDLTTFGKAMANGFAVAALGGKRDIMELGSIKTKGAERVFLTSTTHGAEMSALAAYIKTSEILIRDKVIDHFWKYGQYLINSFNALAKSRGIEEHIYMEGYPCSPNYIVKDSDKQISMAYRTLFAEKMLESNVLMPYIAISASHTDAELDITLTAAEKAMNTLVQALNDKSVGQYLKSPVIKPVFRKFN
jgi:glutamate-1-semialdehyde 2,1-aminomutase